MRTLFSQFQEEKIIEVCSLSSGSNGNAFFIKTGEDGFLVDAGISCKQICARLEEVQSHIDQIKAIFITHEHIDHIQGLDVLVKKYPIPVYITEKTFKFSHLDLDKQLLRFIKNTDSVRIGDTEVHSFPKSHDAADPIFFCFHFQEKKICVITDVGYACSHIKNAVKDADLVFLESNYDEDMLWNGIYPPMLKKRVAGKKGHLSNIMAGELVSSCASDKLEYVFLSHLSENNNTPDLAFHSFLSAIEVRPDLNHLKNQTFLTSRHGISFTVKI